MGQEGAIIRVSASAPVVCGAAGVVEGTEVVRELHVALLQQRWRRAVAVDRSCTEQPAHL
jgi:hypothetical protein